MQLRDDGGLICGGGEQIKVGMPADLTKIANALRFEAFHTSDHATRATMLKAAVKIKAYDEKRRDFHNARECRIVDIFRKHLTICQQMEARAEMEALDREMPWDW